MYRKQEAYPTFLFFNPYHEEKTVETNLGQQTTDVYDAVSRTFIKRTASGSLRFPIPADAARVLVLIPAGKVFSVDDGVLKAGGVPVDYRYGQ